MSSRRPFRLGSLIVTVALAAACVPASDPAPGTPGGSGTGGASGGTGGSARSGTGGSTGGSTADSGTGDSGGADPTPPADAARDVTPPDPTPGPDAAPVDAPPAGSGGGCGPGRPMQAEGVHDLKVGAETRKFILRLPAGYDSSTPWPVIFVFHGAGQSMGYFDGNTNLRAELEDKAVLVLPDGPVKPDGRRSWVFRSADNVVFVDALAEWLNQNLCVDRGRFYATGLSSGGYMSLTVACQRGDMFRAVATCSGGMVETDCKGKTPSVWLRLGKSDSAGTIESVTKARDFWLARNGCTTTNPRPIDPAPCVSYGGCAGGTSVVFCADTGGHGWPAYYAKGIWSEFSKP